jgi:hypothetical protein
MLGGAYTFTFSKCEIVEIVDLKLPETWSQWSQWIKTDKDMGDSWAVTKSDTPRIKVKILVDSMDL